MNRLALIAAALLIASPTLAQESLRDRIAKAGKSELIAGDGPTYRVIVPDGQVLLLAVAGDGRATLTITDRAGKAESRSFSNRQLDALDAALTEARFLGDTFVTSEDCKPETVIMLESIIDGRYRGVVRCNDPKVDKAVTILRGGG